MTTIAVAAAIVLSTFVAYAPALRGEFVWDDNQYVRNNTELRSLHGLWAIWFDPLATPQYHPLVFSSYWLEYHLWGLDPLGYHFDNVALHLLTALLLWRLLTELAVPGGALAAAIFALHPVQLESVAWIAERKNTLSGLLCVTTVLAWMRFVKRRDRRSYVLALVGYAGTLLSKWILAPLPVLLLLLAWWKRPVTWRRRVTPLVPFAAMSLVITVLGWWRDRLYTNPPLSLSLPERVLIMNRAVWFYLGKLLWPLPLIAIYPRWETAVTAWSCALLVLSVVVASALWLAQRRIGRGYLVAASGFVILLAPVLGLVDFNYSQYTFVADHFQYAPSAAPIAAVAAAAVVGLRIAGRAGRAIGSALIGIVLAVFAGLTWAFAAHYATAEVFWQNTLAKNPQAWNAESNLAAVLATAGKLDEAISHYRAALRIKPNFPEAHNQWGIVLAKQGKADEAVAEFDRALELNPNQADAHNNAGAVLAQKGRWADAAQRFAAAVRIHPAYVEAYDSWGIVSLKQGRPEEAIEHFEAALRIQPDYAPAQQHLAATRRLLEGGANGPAQPNHP